MPDYPEPIRIGTMYPPQVLNPDANNGAGAWEILKGSGGAYKSQQIQYVAADYFSGSGNASRSYDEDMHGLSIFNDSDATLTFTLNGVTRPVLAKGSYEQKFKEPFRQIAVTASGQWYCDILQLHGADASIVVPPPVDTTAPTNVTSLTATEVTQSTVSLSWAPATDNVGVTGYDVYRGATLLTTVTGTTYTATGLNADTAYTFTVRAKDAAGNVSSGTSINVTTAAQPVDTTPPDNVTQLQATNVTQTGLTLSWLASASGDLKDYRVYQGSTLIETVTGLSHAVTGLAEGTSYTFTIRARDNANNEASGTSVTVMTEEEAPADITPPADATGLTATPGETSAALSWTASVSSDVAGYNVYNGATKLNGSLITVTAYTASGLTAETEYTFRVTAVDGSGNESDGVTIDVTTSAANVPGEVVFSDDFNRADSTSGLGGTWIANRPADIMGISSNAAYTPTSKPHVVYVQETGYSDGIEITLDVTADDGTASEVGIVLRYVDDSNYLKLIKYGAIGSTDDMRLQRKNGTLVSNLKVGPTDFTVPYTLKVRLEGDRIVCLKGDTVVIDQVSDVNLSATKHGIVINNNIATRVDNFEVKTI